MLFELKEKYGVYKKKKDTRLGGYSIDPMLHLSPTSSAVRTEQSNAADHSVLPSHSEQRAISYWLSALPL